MMLVAAALGGMGLFCMLFRKTLLGFLIGLQLMVLGATTVFVLAGALSGMANRGHIFGLFIVLGGVAQLVAGYALAVRLFCLKKRVEMDELRSLKH